MNVNSFEQGPSNHSYTNSFVHWWIEKMPLGRKSTNSCIPRMTIFLDGRVRFSKVLLLLAEKHHSLYLFIMFTAFPFVRLTAHFHPFTPSSPGQTIPPWLPLATGAVLGRNPFASTFGHSWIVEQIPPADTGRTTTIRPLTNTKVVSLCLARAFCRLLTILIYSVCKNLVHLYKEEPRLKLYLFLVNSVHTAFLLVDIQVWIHWHDKKI
jgi:hypothetical protein